MENSIKSLPLNKENRTVVARTRKPGTWATDAVAYRATKAAIDKAEGR